MATHLPIGETDNKSHPHFSLQFALRNLGEKPLPSWIPGECFFSWASRYHLIAGNRLPEQTNMALFGQRRWGYQHDLPSPLNAFFTRTGGTMGHARAIARERTLLPFYLPHRSQDFAAEAYRAIEEPSSVMIKYRLGILTSRFRGNHPLKACPQCMLEDEHTQGTPIWHRTHQLPGVWVCPKHGLSLKQCTLKATGTSRFAWFLPSEPILTNHNNVEPSPQDRKELFKFAQIAIEWTEMREGSFSAESLSQTYRARILERYKRDSRNSLSASFQAATGHLQVVDELKPLITSQSQASHVISKWVFAPHGNTHPLRHLSLIHWLFESWDDFLKTHAAAQSHEAISRPTFHEARRPERPDPVHQEAIARITNGESASSIAKNLKLSVQTVISWKVTLGIPNQRRPKVLKGDIYSSLVSLLKTGADKEVAAKKFDVSIQTITRVLRSEVGLATEWHNARFEASRHKARAAWCAVILTHAGLGIKHIRQLEPAAFGWLYRNDLEWLRCQNSSIASMRSNHSHIDWDKRDSGLASSVRQAASDLAKNGRKHIRLVDLLQQVPELKAKLNQLKHLPLTRHAVEDVTKLRRGTKDQLKLIEVRPNAEP